VDEDLSELERLEAAKKWWAENYKSIVAGALIAVVVVGGWRYWQYRTQSRNEAASALFADMATAMSKKDDAAAQKAGGDIMDKYADTAYATHAAFALAQLQVTEGKLPEGEKTLQWAIDHAKDPGLKLLAQLRLGRVLLAAGDADGALKALDAKDTGGMDPLFQSVRGDAYAKLGKNDDARAAYQKALDGWTDELGDRSLLQMKLAALPGAPAKAPAAATKAKP
jgi:predicted negative regulator of RcsB-dependent stress response